MSDSGRSWNRAARFHADVLVLLQVDVKRLAGGLHRTQIKLDLDGDGLADEFNGHSP